VCRSLLDYEGPARHLVARLKYRNDRSGLSWLADGMASLLSPGPGVVVAWVPTTAARRRARGFDQAALLARAIARRWRAPCRALLDRLDTAPQTGRSGDERRVGVALGLRLPSARPPDRVVLVDDVLTTGTTLRCAAAVLRGSGVRWIGGLTAARTPRTRIS
jgi:predicted amidophosphoribosyltransferase